MPQKKLDLLLKLPIVSGLVRKKVLGALGLDQCIFAAGGAAPMPLELLQWYAHLGLNIAEGYGMTENVGASHITTGNPTDFGTVGRPYERVQCRIASDTGEIQVNAPWNMLGYYKQPELSQEALTADGWLKTGDKGSTDAQGRLKITGRVKDLFKTSKGKYVAPAPIEDKLVMHVAVEACCVTGANLGQPLALIMLNDEANKQVDNGGKSRARGLARRAPETRQRHAGPARAARLPGDHGRVVDGGQRPDHADLQGQAQPHRGHVRQELRALGGPAQAGGLEPVSRAARPADKGVNSRAAAPAGPSASRRRRTAAALRRAPSRWRPVPPTLVRVPSGLCGMARSAHCRARLQGRPVVQKAPGPAHSNL